MRRMKPETKRKIAGFVAILLIAAMVLSSVSILFIDAAELPSAEVCYEITE